MKHLTTCALALALSGSAASQSLGARTDCTAEANSTGSAATISVTGSDVVGGNPLTLTASGLPNNQFGMFIVSASGGFVAGPGGSQGNLCIGSPIGRFKDQIANSGASGSITASVDTLALPTTPLSTIVGGETWHFQAWYRDNNPTPVSNFTDAVAVGFRDSGITATFQASATSGTAPLTVSFADQSSGVSGHSWSFGDGNTDSAANPSHTYSSPGVYLVEHVTTGSSGSAAEVLRIEVTQSSGPVTFTQVYNAFLQIDPSVGLSCIDCHDSNGFGGLDMPTEAIAYQSLVGVTATCGSGNTRVVAGDAAASLLYQKLAGTQTCGQSMPFGATWSGDLALVFDWIEGGALQ